MYLVTGLSSNQIVEVLCLNGYQLDDAHYYLLDKYHDLQQKYPFIHKVLKNTIDLFRKQYGITPTMSHFRSLLNIMDEINIDYIKVIPIDESSIVNVCAYYQNNRRTLLLKKDTPSASEASSAVAPQQKKLVLTKKQPN